MDANRDIGPTQGPFLYGCLAFRLKSHQVVPVPGLFFLSCTQEEVLVNVASDYSTWRITQGREEEVRARLLAQAEAMSVEKRFLEYGYQQVPFDVEAMQRLAEVVVDVKPDLLPCLNPDGRTVCPDTFYAQGLDTCSVYASGLQRDGRLIPYDSDSDEPLYYFDPQEAIFVGGQFNGAGFAINRRRSSDASDAVEVQAAFEFVQPRGLEAILDLHACANNFAMQARSHEPPYWPVMREWQRRAERLFREKGRKLNSLYGDGDPPEPPPFHFNSSLFHRHAQLMWIVFEGRQGFLGHPGWWPLPTEWEIIDDYLSAITVFLELGVEGYYRQANQQVFGL
jgi:hypothetical protein